MVIPSLFSQFVPSASSRANTDFIRCWAVGLGGVECGTVNGGGATRALGCEATGGDGGVWGICACGGGGVADAGATEGGAETCDGMTGMEGGDTIGAFTGVSAALGLVSTAILSGLTADSGREGIFSGACGFVTGQLLTPPACTVLHHGQSVGSPFAAGAGSFPSVGFTSVGFTSATT